MAPRTKVVVLQHPREVERAIGTAWMVERCLGAERIVGVVLEEDPRFRALVDDRQAPAILLSPGPDALDLAVQPPEGPVTLVVLDGTWSEARKLLRRNPSLSRLQRYALHPSAPSRYRIRREPAPQFISTVEATVAALSCLEPPRGGDAAAVSGVLGLFEAMVDLQLRMAREKFDNRHRQAALARSARAGRQKKLPLLRSGLVVAYGEANSRPHGSADPTPPEVVHMLAERIETGERFEAFIAPERPLSRSFAHHTNIPPEAVIAGEPREVFRARFAAFLREGDVLAGWGSHATELLRREGLDLPPCLDLRSTAARFLGRKAGDAFEVAAALGCPPVVPWAIGRTGIRLANAACVARALSA